MAKGSLVPGIQAQKGEATGIQGSRGFKEYAVSHFLQDPTSPLEGGAGEIVCRTQNGILAGIAHWCLLPWGARSTELLTQTALQRH